MALSERGYKEGQNISIEYRYAEGKSDRPPELAAELLRLKVDILLVSGDPAVRAAMNATKTIPIVLLGAGLDPVEAGFVESLARPGGNVTGITTYLNRELHGKRLELLKEAVPKLARVAFLYDPAVAPSALAAKEDLPAAARALKLTVQTWEVRDLNGLERVLAELNKKRPDGLYVMEAGQLMRANVKRITGFAYGGHMVNLAALIYRPPGQSQTRSEEEQREDAGSTHAGASETSLLLYFRPELVSPGYKNAKPLPARDQKQRTEIARASDWPGYWGSPRFATASAAAARWKVNSSRLTPT